MKKIIALVLALAMVLMVSASFAADETPTNNLTLDGSISISGLEADDTVAFYRVLKFDQNARKTGGWSNDEGFSVSEDKIQKILGLDSDGKPVVITDSNKKDYGIDESLAASIADMAESATAKYNATTNPPVLYTDVTDADGKVTARTAKVTGAADGLYVAIVHPGQAGTIYNPVFVAADYKDNGTNAWTVDLNDSYNPASMAKRGVVTLEKTAYDPDSIDANHSETVSVGDTIQFTVTTKIPEFGNNYTDAVFKVIDELSDGLTLLPETISVAYTGDSEDALPADAYVKPITTSTHGYTINFTTAYLLRLDKATPITITYQAKVDSTANFSVNPEKNTVTVQFSNNPTDKVGKGILKDITNHYSFDIDAELFGEEDYDATEVVKIGVDKDGKELTQTIKLDNQHWVGALQGAEFKLYKDNGSDAKGDPYTNEFYTTDSVFVSDANGRLKLKGATEQGIRGLDAGIYWLDEINAPAGYIKLQDAVKIEIIAVTEEKTYTEEIDGITVTYKANDLKSYSIKIGGKQTANYIMENKDDGTHAHIKTNKGDTVVGGNDSEEGKPSENRDGKLSNIQGVELPSTGGIGTTIFYILGGLLVVGAAVILVARRRVKE